MIHTISGKSPCVVLDVMVRNKLVNGKINEDDFIFCWTSWHDEVNICNVIYLYLFGTGIRLPLVAASCFISELIPSFISFRGRSHRYDVTGQHWHQHGRLGAYLARRRPDVRYIGRRAVPYKSGLDETWQCANVALTWNWEMVLPLTLPSHPERKGLK